MGLGVKGSRGLGLYRVRKVWGVFWGCRVWGCIRNTAFRRSREGTLLRDRRRYFGVL